MVIIRQAVRTSAGKNGFIHFIMLAFIGAVLITAIVSQEPESEHLPTLAEIVAAKVSAVESHSEYVLEIEESGPGYLLQFSGLVSGREIYGTLASYDLEVCVQKGSYYVRGGDMFEDWQEVAGVELDGLKEFVQTPQALIRAMMANKNILINEEAACTEDDINYQVYLLRIPPSDNKDALGLLSGLETKQADARLWFGEEDDFLYKMTMEFGLTSDQAAQIKRTYIMTPKKVELPIDLPQFANRVLEI